MQDDLLSNRVYDQLYAAMISNRLAPGDRLNRRQVATDLGVSVAPVLEAMTQLEWEGFLETKPRQGTVVKSVTPSHSLGRFLLRQAIEVEAARRYAGARIAREKSDLLEIAERLDATKEGSFANWKAEAEFHSRLVRAADCPVLYEAFTHVMRHGLYHAAIRMLPEIPHRAPGLHSRLVETLSKATPEKADTAIRDHLSSWIEALTTATQRAADAPEKRRRKPVKLKPVRTGK
jgi:DNA-binding GntR family transcriptional regulator